MHALPGMELEGGDPEQPSSQVVGEYFRRYEETFDLRVLRPVDVSAVREGPAGGCGWRRTGARGRCGRC